MARLITEAEVARCLDYQALIPLMRETLGRFSRGEAVQPVRTNLAIRPAGGYYGVMPAHLPGPGGSGVVVGGGGCFGLKSVSFFPGNERTALPTHLATILLLDDATGALEAILDGRLITEMRTAAVSAVSVQLLARSEARRLAILGSGVQARSHLEAVAGIRDLESVRVWSRTRENAARFVREMGRRVGCPITAHDTAREAVRGANLVVTATSASEPVLEAAWLEKGAHVCVVGSSHPRKREVDTATVTGSRVFVDSREAAAVEAGDLLVPAGEGAWSLDLVAGELGEVACGAPGRTAEDQLTLFKSLGIAVEDIATARHVVARARELGLGTQIEL